MTDRECLTEALRRMNAYKPRQQDATVDALARLAKKQGLHDDTREALWTARHIVRCSSPLLTISLLSKELGRRI